ncbi:MAG: DNA repair protein RecN [Solirubrobacterales bacterium]
MLRELRIENLLLIERAELLPGEGLNVLTGETGAGKTVLAHSLDLLMGGKARRGIVRPGADEAWVEGVFDLPSDWAESERYEDLRERLPEGTDELVLGRRVFAGGRTSAFIGGRAASAPELQLVSEDLIAFYGQHEHRKLTIGSAQLEMVDGSGGEGHGDLLSRYRDAFGLHREARAELEVLTSGERARERDLDLHRFELAEIEEAGPREEEKIELMAERERLRHADRLLGASAGAAAALRGDGLEGGATAGVSGAAEGLEQVHGVDANLDILIERVKSLTVEMDDIGVELREYASGIEADPEMLIVIEERLDLLSRLERKHGGSIGTVLAHASWCRAQIAALEGGESRETELRETLERLSEELTTAAGDLTESRREAAKKLAKRVTADLADLAMDGAVLTVDLVPAPDGMGPSGAETVEFMLSANPGIEARPLRDTASGGELSRVMLALAEPGSRDRRTLVFDEIDAGIGGKTATVVGERLRDVSSARQVVAITHLPQVASKAGTHFTVLKDGSAEPARATVSKIEGEAVVEEIRRMMGGESGDVAATRHARQLVSTGQ